MSELPSYDDPFELDLTGKTALVTGASSGIGRACACYLASVGVHLKLVARREERLQQLQQALQTRYNRQVDYLVADLGEPQALEQLEKQGFLDVDILINNAGLALGREAIAQSNLEEWEQMLNLNIKAAFFLTQKTLPFLQAKGEGDIVLLSSIAAHISYEGGSIYCATKHALRAFGTALRKETCGTNIRVFQISPGMVATEFSQVRFRGNQEQAQAVYQGMEPLTANDIARQIVWGLKQPRHMNLDEVIIMASAQGGVDKVVRRA